MIVGNDISKWQGQINWPVYKNNSNFIIIKATEGVGFTDPLFSTNQREVRRTGLLRGYYHFARPDLGNAPEFEADYFLQVVGALNEGEVLALDYECANQVQAHVDWCRLWLNRVKEKTGIKALIYLNQSQVQRFNWQEVVDGGYGLWIAAYLKTASEPWYAPTHNDFVKGQWPFAAMQQWTSQQQVPGIQGNVDGNVFFGDQEAFKKYGYHKPTPPPPPPVEPPPVPTPSPMNWEATVKQASAILYGKGWPWQKVNKLKTIIPKYG